MSLAQASSPAATETGRWQAGLSAELQRRKRYPSSLVRAARESGTATPSGRVKLAFEIDDIGRIVSSRVAESSGVPEFDAAALAMVKIGSRLPRPPKSIPKDDYQFVVPVRFVGAPPPGDATPSPQR